LPGSVAAYLPGWADGIRLPGSLTGGGFRWSPIGYRVRPGRQLSPRDPLIACVTPSRRRAAWPWARVPITVAAAPISGDFHVRLRSQKVLPPRTHFRTELLSPDPLGRVRQSQLVRIRGRTSRPSGTTRGASCSRRYAITTATDRAQRNPLRQSNPANGSAIRCRSFRSDRCVSD
jgi:hypothetical protein